MNSLIEYILSLFTNSDAARAFVYGPQQAMADNGLVNVTPNEFAMAAANAMPGLNLGGGDPIGGLQQAVADQYGYGYAPAYDAAAYDPGYYGGGGDYYGGGPGYALASDAAYVVNDAAAVAGTLGADLISGVDGGLLNAGV